ncbi:MAG: penicillin acylase family protein, partial [Bacteroidota bacterium]
MKKSLLLALQLFAIHFLFAQINPDRIDIVRDQWGVPHIFAPTDAEVAYGLAWATAEDDFKTMQQQLLPIRGLAGQVFGVKGAVADVAVHLVEAHQIVEARYATDISPAFKKYLEAYAAGANAYAAKYPEEVLHKKLFPVRAKDVVKAFVLGVSLMAHVPRDLQQLLNNKVKAIQLPPATGSNAFAISRRKTTDDKTYLAINAHQPLEGVNSWYEAHLCSEEGLNILGACFAGSPVITVGANEQLGWAHTLNYADFADIFQLEMHPTDKRKYRFDNQWLTLEKYHTKARIKIMGFLKVGKKQRFYKSKYGVTFETDNGFFALRFPANHNIQSPEQWHRMSKANDWKSFRAAIDMQALPSMNLVYADRDDHIHTGQGLHVDGGPKAFPVVGLA